MEHICHAISLLKSTKYAYSKTRIVIFIETLDITTWKTVQKGWKHPMKVGWKCPSEINAKVATIVECRDASTMSLDELMYFLHLNHNQSLRRKELL
jgi:hypothetical protein